MPTEHDRVDEMRINYSQWPFHHLSEMLHGRRFPKSYLPLNEVVTCHCAAAPRKAASFHLVSLVDIARSVSGRIPATHKELRCQRQVSPLM